MAEQNNIADRPAEKIDIQKEVFAKDIERVEELRYHISDRTYDSLRKKRSGKLQQTTELDKQINEMRKEFENKNLRLKQAGLEYLIVNKKHLNDLRSRFMQLSNEERDNALEGIGAGAKLIDEMNDLLQHNFNKKMEIAKLIMSFNSLTGEKGKVKEAIEGDLEFTIAQLNGDEFTLNKFLNSADELGFLCKNSKGKIMICKNEEDEENQDQKQENKESQSQFVPELPGIPEKEMKEEIKSPLAIKPLPIQPTQTLTPKAQIPLQTHKIPEPEQDEKENVDMEILQKEHEKDLKDIEKREKEMRDKAWLNVAEMEREEVEARMRKILTNIKMQRWVLGTFKDQTEKEEYGKAQILLTALMKRKRELLEIK